MGSQKWAIPFIGTQTVVSTSDKTDTVHRVGRNGRWQPFDTSCILLKPHSGSTGPIVHSHGLTVSAKSPL